MFCCSHDPGIAAYLEMADPSPVENERPISRIEAVGAVCVMVAVCAMIWGILIWS